MRARYLIVSLFVVLSFLIANPITAGASNVIMNHFGFTYEDGGFPTSDPGDVLTGVGVITATSIGCDLTTKELTWVIRDLVSDGQTSPDGGRTLIVSYSGGTIGLYNDPSMNHDWGTTPPNATAPSTFEDGDQFLMGAFSQFTLFYDTYYNIGSFQGIVSFTAGTNLDDLPAPNGLIFAGALGPALDPNIPDGYDLEAVGQIIAPRLCNVRGVVEYYDPETGESGIVEDATIDLVDNENTIFSTMTDASGDYWFYDAAGEILQVSINVPLGYIPNGDTAVLRICQTGGTVYVNFQLIRVEPVDMARSKGFWKHQVNSALRGKTNGIHHDGAEMLVFLNMIHDHFDPYFDLYPDVHTLPAMREVLEQQPQFTQKASQFDKARAQLLALLLNTVSNRLLTWQVVSDDGATLSQTITYIADLLTDAEEANDLLAKDIAEDIVLGRMIGSGVIPLDIPQIAYLPGDGDRDGKGMDEPDIQVTAAVAGASMNVYPNPFNPVTTISYELAGEAQVSLVIYNVRGQAVRELVNNKAQRGLNRVLWDGRDNRGREVASGVYFSHLRVGQEVTTKRLVLIR